MKKDSPEVLKAAHADIEHYVHDILSSSEFAQFLPTMRAAGLLTPFIRAAPHHGEVTEPAARLLKEWVDLAASVDETRALFQKVYPTLHDEGKLPFPTAAAKLDEAHAKEMFLHEIQYGAGTYYVDHVSHGDLVKWVTSRYDNVPLYKWWKYLVVDGNSQDGAYRFEEMAARVRCDWTFAYLTRAGSPYIKLKSAAFHNRVSWYSVSSPLEWFAEQYAHFYRTEKTRGGLIVPATKHLLERLDHESFKAGAGHGHAGQGAGAGSEEGDGDGASGQAQAPQVGSGASGAAARAAAGGGTQAGTAPHTEPLFFPW